MLEPVELSADERATFQGWMKGLQPQVAETRSAIVTRDNALAAQEAGKLAALFDPLVDFRRKHDDPDALQFAATGREAAKSIAAGSTLYEHEIGLQKLNAACQGCHLAHRGGKPGAFTVVQ